MRAKDRPSSSTNIPPEERSHKMFEQVYHEHVTALFQYGSQFRTNQVLIEDCVQELFADLWENRHTLDTIRSIRSYLLGALRRKILRKIYALRERPLDSEDLFVLANRQTTGNSWDHQGQYSEETTKQLTTALQKLTYKQQEVLYLRFYNQLSFQEIAEIMSVQTRTVYKLCHRAITTLNTYFSETLQTSYLLSLLLLYFR
ncbi:MAG: sigma-70 family RNA polymerase sigma factor [Bacteroidota bacterium]